MRKIPMLLCCAGTLLLRPALAGEPPVQSAKQILQTYAADFRHDPAAAEPITFGVRVTGEGGGDWHVVVVGRSPQTDESSPVGKPRPTTGLAAAESKTTAEFEVMLEPGLPAEPSAYYVLDLATLRKIDRGELNALTAIAKARGGQTAPMDIGVMPGFEPGSDFWARFVPLSFHFWTRGLPERVPFRGELSRVVHGANAVVFYYQTGFRSAWFQVSKGQHVNKDPQDQTNPFPSMFIMLRGKLEAKIAGRQLTLPAGEMMFVPPGVTHEFWNAHDEPVEMIALMFGEGA
jgi:mannose-6-phosphate isomerase-like protein (cupin superfamily)